MVKLRVKDKSLQQFFSLKSCDMDSSSKGERINNNKVPRNVVYCHDIQGLVNHVYKFRNFKPEENDFIKVGMDGGGNFLKFCVNFEQQSSEPTSSTSELYGLILQVLLLNSSTS